MKDWRCRCDNQTAVLLLWHFGMEWPRKIGNGYLMIVVEGGSREEVYLRCETTSHISKGLNGFEAFDGNLDRRSMTTWWRKRWIWEKEKEVYKEAAGLGRVVTAEGRPRRMRIWMGASTSKGMQLMWRIRNVSHPNTTFNPGYAAKPEEKVRKLSGRQSRLLLTPLHTWRKFLL
jgi:hypothetical protein